MVVGTAPVTSQAVKVYVNAWTCYAITKGNHHLLPECIHTACRTILQDRKQ